MSVDHEHTSVPKCQDLGSRARSGCQVVILLHSLLSPAEGAWGNQLIYCMKSFPAQGLRAGEEVGGWCLLRALKKEARSELGAS